MPLFKGWSPLGKSQPKAYCAIDVGSVSCSYAYSFEGSKDVWMNKNWADHLGFISERAPSAILYDKEGKPELFGFEAIEEYKSLCEEDLEKQQFCYEGLLKPNLDQTAQADSSASGGKENERCVPELTEKTRCDLAMLLARHCEKALKDKHSKFKENGEIVWVFVIPLSWPTQEKKQFRDRIEEAIQKEMKEQSNKIQLVVSTEALWLASKEHLKEKLKNSKKKDHIALLHSGGSTTEMSIHTKSSGPNHVKFISISTGGRLINGLFGRHLVKFLNCETGDFLKIPYIGAWLDLMLKFEASRTAFHYRDEGSVKLDISYAFYNVYKQITGKDLLPDTKQSNSSGENDMSLSQRDKLILSMALAKNICRNVLEIIWIDIKSTINDYKVSDILLTGGFGESVVMHDFIKENTDDNDGLTLYTPENSTSLLTRGAVLAAKQNITWSYNIVVLYRSESKSCKSKVMMYQSESEPWKREVLIKSGQSVQVGYPFKVDLNFGHGKRYVAIEFQPSFSGDSPASKTYPLDWSLLDEQKNLEGSVSVNVIVDRYQLHVSLALQTGEQSDPFIFKDLIPENFDSSFAKEQKAHSGQPNSEKPVSSADSPTGESSCVGIYPTDVY